MTDKKPPCPRSTKALNGYHAYGLDGICINCGDVSVLSKRGEMTDNKLDELIKEAIETAVWYADEYCDDVNGDCAKTRQAIIDYVADDRSDLVRRNNELDNIAHDLEYKLEEALRPIRKVWERFQKDKDGGFKHCNTHGNTMYWLDKVLFAIKTALREK